MNNLIIKATKSSPKIFFNYEDNILEIKGSSYPANISEFYTPVFSWLEKYTEQLENQKVTVNVELIYFNSSSSKILMEFFDILDELAGNGKNVSVNWIYEDDDDDSVEFGEEFQEDLETIKFNYVQKKEIDD